jgi:hypothetical protein
MLQGLYLYAICKKTQKVREFESKSIDGSTGVFVFPRGRIEAIVSSVDPTDYQGEEIQIKAKDDLDWIVTHAKRHEAVLEEVMGSGETLQVLIPMKFGTIFTSKETLEQMMKEQEGNFVNLLEQLEGMQEWNIRIDANMYEINKATEQMPQYKQAKHRALQAPKGMDYFEEMKAQDLFSALTQDYVEDLRQRVTKSLEGFVYEFRENHINTQDLHEALLEAQEKGSGRVLEERHPMLHRAYLIKQERASEFHTQIQGLQRAFPELIIERSGPWPPYNFLT